MDKLVQILNSIPGKIAQAIKTMQKSAEHQTPPSHQPEEQKQMPVNQVAIPSQVPKLPIKKIAIVFGGIILFLVILSVVMKLLPRGNGLIPSGATPTNTAVVATPVSTPTQYSDDPEVLNLEQSTKTLDEQLKQIQLDESNLRPRPLDFDVNFN